METIRQLRKIEDLWDYARQGRFLVIIPCDDADDVQMVVDHLQDADLEGWVGLGHDEHGTTKFVVTISNKVDASTRALIRRCGLSAITADGFDLNLLWAIISEGENKTFLRQPFGISAQIEHSPSGAMILSFNDPESPKPTRTEWLRRLQRAYCEITGCRVFTFNEQSEGSSTYPSRRSSHACA